MCWPVWSGLCLAAVWGSLVSSAAVKGRAVAGPDTLVGTAVKASARLPASAGKPAGVPVATGPVGPNCGVLLWLVVAVVGMSGRIGYSAQCSEVTSATAVVTFTPNGWAAHLRVGITTAEAFRVSGGESISMGWWISGWGEGDTGYLSSTLSLALLEMLTALFQLFAVS